MKILEKIKMLNATELNDRQMKMIYGRNGGSGDYNGGSGSGGSGYFRCFRCANGHEGIIGATTMDAIWDLFADHCPAGGGLWEC